ncbi:MAG: hypothetical protein LQ338_008324, partial [Usnochroma carphineum]
ALMVRLPFTFEPNLVNDQALSNLERFSALKKKLEDCRVDGHMIDQLMEDEIRVLLEANRMYGVLEKMSYGAVEAISIK